MNELCLINYVVVFSLHVHMYSVHETGGLLAYHITAVARSHILLQH